MRVTRIEDLPQEPARAVIINVRTELVTTLALASVRAHSSIPVLLIDCDPTPESSSYFEELMAIWSFELLDAPLRIHGVVLDDLFRRVRAETVLLLDSDAEIRDAALITELCRDMELPHVFAAGFVSGPGWMGEPCSPETALFQERPWMPCVLFRTSDVRAGLAAGISFRARVVYNDFMFSSIISRHLAKRFQNTYVPGSRIVRRLPMRMKDRLRSSTLPWLRWVRQDFYGLRPNYVYYDTGAAMYQWCKYRKRRTFAGGPLEVSRDRVAHYWGVTRSKLDPDTTTATALVEIEGEVRSRLREVYDVRPELFGDGRSVIGQWTPSGPGASAR